jgi:hypothetical protein
MEIVGEFFGKWNILQKQGLLCQTRRSEQLHVVASVDACITRQASFWLARASVTGVSAHKLAIASRRSP